VSGRTQQEKDDGSRRGGSFAIPNFLAYATVGSGPCGLKKRQLCCVIWYRIASLHNGTLFRGEECLAAVANGYRDIRVGVKMPFSNTPIISPFIPPIYTIYSIIIPIITPSVQNGTNAIYKY
jgi:hypothetical protein